MAILGLEIRGQIPNVVVRVEQSPYCKVRSRLGPGAEVIFAGGSESLLVSCHGWYLACQVNDEMGTEHSVFILPSFSHPAVPVLPWEVAQCWWRADGLKLNMLATCDFG